MLAGSKDKNAVSIYWPHWRQRLEKIRRSGRCPSFSVPRHLPVPGGLVALVDGGGRVRLLFQIERIDEGISVVAANGKRYKHGCVLIARKNTTRLPGKRDPKKVRVHTFAPGVFAYFNVKTLESQIYKPGDRERQAAGPTRYSTVYCSFLAKTIGTSLSQPERRLVEAYVKWVGDETLFGHRRLYGSGLYTDLFIKRCWTLIEAKASTERKALREAVGQLLDYQRHYPRSPSIAVLLPEKLPSEVMGLFRKTRIAVVWRSGEAFRDSADGRLTSDLRAAAKKRRS